MGKLKYKGDLQADSEDFSGGFDLTVKSNGKEARWVNAETGAMIVVEGKNLSAHEENPDLLTNGKITGFTVYNADEKVRLEITNISIPASYVTVGLDMGGYMGAIDSVALKKDTAIGSSKNDFIFSGGGNDTLTGKGGSDTFYFHSILTGQGVEQDVITDFDTKGADADTLQFVRMLEGYKGINGGDDTRLTFADDSTLLLEGVTKAEFKTYWDGLPT
jgi:Ca2+-binding RTX toxin-like protein